MGGFDDDAAQVSHRAALTEGLTEASARFLAGIRRLARTVLRDELDSLRVTFEPMPPGAGTRAEHAGPVGGTTQIAGR